MVRPLIGMIDTLWPLCYFLFGQKRPLNSLFSFKCPVILGGKISFCYIDGNHTYDFVKRDFENTNCAMVRGGFILFDDSADSSDWEVNRLTREISAGSQYELISKNPNYLFRKI